MTEPRPTNSASPPRTVRKTGILLILVSAVIFSMAGVFTKGVEAGAWEVIFWRGVFATFFTIAYILWRGTLRADTIEMGWSGLAAAAIGASATAAFLTAFKLTTMANVILIYAAAPLFAAAFTYIIIREKLSLAAGIGCLTAFVGVWIIVQGASGGGSFTGDLLALWMTIGMSFVIAIYRIWPNTPAAGPAALSSILLLPFGYVFGDIFVISAFDFTMLALFGLIFAAASVTLAEGVKRVAAGEAALLSTLETPLAPILGWLFFMEVPAATTFIGGGIIFAAVLGSQLFSKDN